MTLKQIFYRGILGWLIATIRWIKWFYSIRAEERWLVYGVYVDRRY
jgi:hypothetical protein